MFKTLCVLSTFIASSVMAMDFEPVRLSVWKRGETILGDEFVAATEAVADYVTALPRPTQSLKPNIFECQVKGRVVSPSVHTNGPTPTNSSWTPIITIYDIKDCVAIK